MKWQRMMHVLGVPAIFALCGCASFGRGVRDLTASEKAYLTALREGVTANQPKLQNALDDIGHIHDETAAREQRDLLGAIAKAKLLESLRSPWAPAPNTRETQRAVVLFHLYDLAQSEQRAFEAAQAQRAAVRAQIASHWIRIEDLLSQATDNQEQILKDLNQPADQQVANVVGDFLAEAKAFQSELAKSDDPELKRLADETERALAKVDNAKDQLDGILKLVHGLDGASTSQVPAAGTSGRGIR